MYQYPADFGTFTSYIMLQRATEQRKQDITRVYYVTVTHRRALCDHYSVFSCLQADCLWSDALGT